MFYFYCFCLFAIFRYFPFCFQGGALAQWLERRTPDRETRVRSSRGQVCCFLEQETFTPHLLLLVIPRNRNMYRWLRLNMTEKLFTGTLNNIKKMFLEQDLVFDCTSSSSCSLFSCYFYDNFPELSDEPQQRS